MLGAGVEGGVRAEGSSLVRERHQGEGWGAGCHVVGETWGGERCACSGRNGPAGGRV